MEKFIDELKDFFIDPFLMGDWLGIAVGVLLWIVCLALLALIVCGLYSLIDSTGLQRIKGRGRVIEKRFKESHTTTTMIFNAGTKTMTPIITHHPDSWIVKVLFNGVTGEINVSENDYVKIKHNTDVPIEYSVGRLSGKCYLKSIKV